jgi:hypothetical protein
MGLLSAGTTSFGRSPKRSRALEPNRLVINSKEEPMGFRPSVFYWLYWCPFAMLRFRKLAPSLFDASSRGYDIKLIPMKPLLCSQSKGSYDAG